MLIKTGSLKAYEYNLKCQMPADWLMKNSKIINYLDIHNFLIDSLKNWMLTNVPLMQWATILFFSVVYEPFKFNYSWEQFLICTDLQCACLTSMCSTNALKAKEAVFLPHYSPESLIRIQILYAMKAGSGAQDGKIPWKIQQEATCCPRRGRPLP